MIILVSILFVSIGLNHSACSIVSHVKQSCLPVDNSQSTLNNCAANFQYIGTTTFHVYVLRFAEKTLEVTPNYIIKWNNLDAFR